MANQVVTEPLPVVLEYAPFKVTVLAGAVGVVTATLKEPELVPAVPIVKAEGALDAVSTPLVAKILYT